MSRISALVLTLNEAENIGPCLDALNWTDEQVVLDSGSTDATVAIAAARGARVAERRFDTWADQRNHALRLATCEWALFVDADERAPPELASEIRAAVKEADGRGIVGYWLPRQNLIVGRWIRHGGWFPDYQLRLFQRVRGHYDPSRPVHEIVVLDGPSARLRSLLVHHNYASWRQFWARQRGYARHEAARLKALGVRPKPHNYVLQPLREFHRRYWELAGHRDGAHGLILAALLGYFTIVAYVDLRRLWRSTRSPPAPLSLQARGGEEVGEDTPHASRGQPARTSHSARECGQALIAPAPPDVTAVVVAYNVASLLERCVASLLAEAEGSGLRCELLVVDNASMDGSADLVRARFPQARLIANAENRGFAAAVNQGLAAAGGRQLLLVNPDCELLPGALGALVGYMAEHAGVGVVAPQLLNGDRTPQSSRRRFPSLGTLFVESTLVQWRWPRWPVRPLLERFYAGELPDDQAQAVDWAMGACLLARREVVEQVGGLDERFFMYFEELDWCRRVREAGWEVHWLPAARALHYHSRSADQDVLARDVHFHESKYRYAAKYWGPAAASALRCFIGTLFALEVIEQSLKLAAEPTHSRRADRRRQRLRHLAAVLRWHVTGRI